MTGALQGVSPEHVYVDVEQVSLDCVREGCFQPPPSLFLFVFVRLLGERERGRRRYSRERHTHTEGRRPEDLGNGPT